MDHILGHEVLSYMLLDNIEVKLEINTKRD